MNKKRTLRIQQSLMLVTLATLFWFGLPASAQTSAQSSGPQDQTQEQTKDTTRAQLAGFDIFLDSHPEIAEQLRKDPSLVKSDEFRDKHPALQEFFEQHPGVREELAENPNAFMRQEQRFDRREDGRDHDTTRAELAGFDRFLDSHPEIAEQLRKDPSLVKNDEFRKNHPALQEFFEQHPGIREEIAENPNAFMRQEQRFDRREDGRDHDPSSRDLADFGQFLGDHSGIAQQLSKDPALANNQKFMNSHPELQQYLTAHPGIRDRLTQNPQAVMTWVQPLNNGKPAKPFNLDTKPTPMQKQWR
jgi:phage-related protein